MPTMPRYAISPIIFLQAAAIFSRALFHVDDRQRDASKRFRARCLSLSTIRTWRRLDFATAPAQRQAAPSMRHFQRQAAGRRHAARALRTAAKRQADSLMQEAQLLSCAGHASNDADYFRSARHGARRARTLARHEARNGRHDVADTCCDARHLRAAI